ncbi:hypothetical protein [Gordonia hydrophobica]|uniref:Lipoprotein n=1 Tax=Gordonia hydrophobica TaxID=40516 RepID=A0ABZ2U0B9_9ACTN|nr:hypothetical protein [Gordonia hydrophobica]MBM7369110.1 hypothetical protein [Gordonia hydrophobica]
MSASLAGRMKALWAASLLTAVVPMAVACNNANAFADRYTEFLASQPAVETFTVRPNNSLPTAESVDSSVTLRSGLSDAQATQAIRTLAGHRVDEKVGQHRIRVTIPSRNATSDIADVTLTVIPGSDEPRTGDASTFGHWVQRARALVAADPTVTDLHLWADSVTADTVADGYPLAERLDAFVAEEPAGLVRLSVSAPPCNLAWDAHDSLRALAPYQDLVALLPTDVVPTHCRASSQQPLTEPSFFLTLPRGTTPETLDAVRDRAAALDLAAKITVAP